MEFTKEELVLMLQMLQQITIADARAKVTAGQLQLKIEAQLSEQAPSPPQSEQE